MKMTIREAINHFGGLTAINKAFPVNLGYAISRNIKNLQVEVKSYDDERKKLCQRLSAKDANGKPIMIDKGNGTQEYDISDADKEMLAKEMEELLETETDVDIRMMPESVFEKIAESERYDIPDISDFTALDFMIESGK